MTDKEKSEPNSANQNTKPVGIDVRNVSAERYKDIPEKKEILEGGGRERHFHEQKLGLAPIEDDIENAPGVGSKTEGAFGKDHTGPNHPLNVRYRKDEISSQK